jgi:hypothetical protein
MSGSSAVGPVEARGSSSTPSGTIDLDYRIWVVDSGRTDVQVFVEAGTFLTLSFPDDDSVEHQLSRPRWRSTSDRMRTRS